VEKDTIVSSPEIKTGPFSVGDRVKYIGPKPLDKSRVYIVDSIDDTDCPVHIRSENEMLIRGAKTFRCYRSSLVRVV